ncbi:hypothetical protein KM043_010857 [Ampulex compressa]|nr:hypothetical protein KM043_010857 [Ampulex compressa]
MNNESFVEPRAHSYDDGTEMLSLQFEGSLTPGVYTLYLKFQSVTWHDLYGFYGSFYRDERGDKVWLGATHFQMSAARRVFPCWDEPALKATFNISIKHYANYTALSNMPSYAQSDLDEGDGKIWTHFETTPLISTNVLGFVVADYEYVSSPDGRTKIWSNRYSMSRAAYFLDLVQKAAAELSLYTNSSTRVPKMDHVTIPQYSSRATENWGMIVYRDDALQYDPDVDTTATAKLNTLTVTHELSHQWFGNLVSPSWWKYYWLSEGMATYLKFYITDRIYKDWRLMEQFVTDLQQQGAFLMDSNPLLPPMNQDYQNPWTLRRCSMVNNYVKSPAVLRMVSHIVSEDVFHNGILKYINEHEYSAVTSDDLWKALQDALDESDIPHQDFRLKEVMDTWTEQTGFPLVTVNRNYTTGETTVRQEIYRYSLTDSNVLDDTRGNKWWIPLSYSTRSNPDFTSTLARIWSRPDQEVTRIEGIDEDDWIIVNVQQSGYYRVNYDERNWMRIAEYLNSDDYNKIHVLNRAQIIDDAASLTMTERLSPVIFIKLTNYLSRETDAIPWRAAFSAMRDLRKYITHAQGGKILKPHILNLMNALIESIGFEEHPEDSTVVKIQRAEIAMWACRLGHSQCKAAAAAKLAAHMQDPKVHKISPDLKEWIYSMGLTTANESTWDRFLELHVKDLTPRIIDALSSSENETIIEKLLNMTIMQGSKIPRIKAPEIIMDMNYENPIVVDKTIDFLMRNWDTMLLKLHNPMNNLLSVLEPWINTREQYDKVELFLQSHGISRVGLYDPEKLTNIEQQISKLYHWVKSSKIEFGVTSTSNAIP